MSNETAVKTDVEMEELNETNKELAEFLGENTGNLPEAANETIEAEMLDEGKMNASRPQDIDDEVYAEMVAYADDFVARLKANPTDMTLASEVFKIGQRSANISMPKVQLYDKLIADIMEEEQKGDNVQGSRGYNLLKLKQQLDLINPAVLSKTPIKKKFLLFLTKTQLPASDKIIDMIYERQETVQSTVDGIKVSLLQNASDLDSQLADLVTVFNGLKKSHMLLKGEIYSAQLIYDKVIDLLAETTDPIAKQNVEAVLADLTTQINSLLVEENMNAQFFAGSTMTAKLVREQQNQIRNLVRQMEKAVLANLGLRVVAKSLERSVNASKALGGAIAETMADTAKSNEKTADKLQQARTEGYIDLAKLEEGVRSLEATFEKEAKANALIIKQGLAVSKALKKSTDRLEERIDMSRTITPEQAKKPGGLIND